MAFIQRQLLKHGRGARARKETGSMAIKRRDVDATPSTRARNEAFDLAFDDDCVRDVGRDHQPIRVDRTVS